MHSVALSSGLLPVLTKVRRKGLIKTSVQQQTLDPSFALPCIFQKKLETQVVQIVVTVGDYDE